MKQLIQTTVTYHCQDLAQSPFHVHPHACTSHYILITICQLDTSLLLFSIDKFFGLL